MNRLQIELFLTLAENKNFTKTANAHNTTQPTVSRQIQMLEEELGTCLFIRNRRSIHITKSGEDSTSQSADNEVREAVENAKDAIEGAAKAGAVAAAAIGAELAAKVEGNAFD